MDNSFHECVKILCREERKMDNVSSVFDRPLGRQNHLFAPGELCPATRQRPHKAFAIRQSWRLVQEQLLAGGDLLREPFHPRNNLVYSAC